MRVVLYDDYIGAAPLVDLSAQIRPHREAFSFLTLLFLGAIVLTLAISVNLGSEAAGSVCHAPSLSPRGPSTSLTVRHPALQAPHSICPPSTPVQQRLWPMTACMGVCCCGPGGKRAPASPARLHWLPQPPVVYWRQGCHPVAPHSRVSPLIGATPAVPIEMPFIELAPGTW